MGFGGLATIGVQRPPNLSIAVFDNRHFAETGMQTSHTAAGVDLARRRTRLRASEKPLTSATNSGCASSRPGSAHLLDDLLRSRRDPRRRAAAVRPAAVLTGLY